MTAYTDVERDAILAMLRGVPFSEDAACRVLDSVASSIAARAAKAERERCIAVLRDHYLMGITCDKPAIGPHRDNAVCGCSRVFLGWHPTVGEARESWLRHVDDLLAGETDD